MYGYVVLCVYGFGYYVCYSYYYYDLGWDMLSLAYFFVFLVPALDLPFFLTYTFLGILVVSYVYKSISSYFTYLYLLYASMFISFICATLLSVCSSLLF